MKRRVYSRLFKYLHPYKSHFVLGAVCMVIFGASDGVVPFIAKYMLDEVFVNQNQNFLYLIPVMLIAFSIVRAVSDFGQQFLMARIGHNIVRDVRRELNSHVLKLSPDFFISNSSAQLLSRVTSDVLLIRQLLTDCLAAIVRDTIRVVVLLGAAIYLDPLLALMAFVVFPIGIYPVYRFGRKIRKLSKQAQDGIGTLSARMQESMIGNRVVKIFGREKFEEARFNDENERLNTTFIKSEKTRALTGPVNEVLASVGISAVVLYGGFSVIGGTRSQGDFIAFILSVFLMYDPFKKLSRLNTYLQQGIAGADRIFEILDLRPSIMDPEIPAALPKSNEIEFEGVSFTYATSEGAALKDITLRIKESQKVAFVGFSGAGKTTLVDLIPRFIAPTKGVLRIGGMDISRVKLSDLRSRIAMVGQHTFLFNDSVYNNIAYGNENTSRDKVYEVARAAYAYDFIMQLPQGFDTIIGESGLSLSGGERQRIAIARALLKNSPILILDEATASLDNRSEREVQAALEALEKGRTSLIIAHRLSTVRSADLIVVLKDGCIVETGNHEALLARGGEYAKLHDLQFEERDEKVELNEAVIN